MIYLPTLAWCAARQWACTDSCALPAFCRQPPGMRASGLERFGSGSARACADDQGRFRAACLWRNRAPFTRGAERMPEPPLCVRTRACVHRRRAFYADLADLACLSRLAAVCLVVLGEQYRPFFRLFA